MSISIKYITKLQENVQSLSNMKKSAQNVAVILRVLRCIQHSSPCGIRQYKYSCSTCILIIRQNKAVRHVVNSGQAHSYGGYLVGGELVFVYSYLQFVSTIDLK